MKLSGTHREQASRGEPSPSETLDHSAGDDQGLKKSLSNRHITMIALGGIIGAGLFVGSGPAINTAGPAVILSYCLSGLLIILVIRAIGEMAVARPSQGSVAEYPRLALGNWAGFTVGWLYWYFWVVIAAVEAVGGAGILSNHLPDVPSWLIGLGLMLIMTGVNLFSVKIYGETEFWFASIKVVGIIIFLAICVLYMTGLWHPSPGGTHLLDDGGFFPNGGLAVIVAGVSIMFSMGGAEIATIAAAESKDPARYAGRATRQVMTRVMLFYVASILLIVTVIPWNVTNFTGEGLQSPFTVALKQMDVPFASIGMEVVVLTAVLSSLNSCLYITSRSLFALGRFHDAPKKLNSVTRRGVPAWAILAGTSGGYIAVIFNYFFPDQIFNFLITSSGALMFVYYIIWVIAQIRLRYQLQKTDPDSLKLKMWFFPYLSYVTIAWMLAVLGLMLWLPSTRAQVLLSVLSLIVVLGAYLLRRRFGASSEDVSGADLSTNPGRDQST